MKKIIIILLAVLSIVMVYNNFNKSENVKIPDSAIRFRVLANSNSPRDQKIKEDVRDKMQKELYTLLENSKSIKEARGLINDNMDNFNNILNCIGLIVMAVGVVSIYDARNLTRKFFSTSDMNTATRTFKIVGFLISMIGIAIFLF